MFVAFKSYYSNGEVFIKAEAIEAIDKDADDRTNISIHGQRFCVVAPIENVVDLVSRAIVGPWNGEAVMRHD